MKTTAELMQKALTIKPAAEWARQLGITRSLFTNAKYRGNLSPIVAGEIAGEIGEDPQRWIVIATLETGKDSACKERLMERLRKTHITLMMYLHNRLHPTATTFITMNCVPETRNGN